MVREKVTIKTPPGCIYARQEGCVTGRENISR